MLKLVLCLLEAWYDDASELYTITYKVTTNKFSASNRGNLATAISLLLSNTTYWSRSTLFSTQNHAAISWSPRSWSCSRSKSFLSRYALDKLRMPNPMSAKWWITVALSPPPAIHIILTTSASPHQVKSCSIQSNELLSMGHNGQNSEFREISVTECRDYGL